MNKTDLKDNTRIHFSKPFKRRALLAYANGKKAKEILNKESSDKKYASKLIHKWRNELYKNPNLIALIYENIDLEHFYEEIDLIGDDFEVDDFKSLDDVISI